MSIRNWADRLSSRSVDPQGKLERTDEQDDVFEAAGLRLDFVTGNKGKIEPKAPRPVTAFWDTTDMTAGAHTVTARWSTEMAGW